jgi:hypothetical protein
MTTPYPTLAGGGCPSDHGDRKGADTPRMYVIDGNSIFHWKRKYVFTYNKLLYLTLNT